MPRYSIVERREVHGVCEAILDRLDELGDEPDAWEEACLVHALSFMESGLYERARRELADCIMPVDGRPAWRAAQVVRNPRRYTRKRLRTRLNHLIAETG